MGVFKSEWITKKSVLDLKSDGLEYIFDDFGPIADKFSFDGDCGPV